MAVTDAAPGRSTQQVVAAGLAAVGAVLLGTKAVRSFGPDPYGIVEPAAGLAVAVVSLVALAAAFAALRAPSAARMLTVAALLGSLLVDRMPAAPPRLIPVLPLGLAVGLLFVPFSREGGEAGRGGRDGASDGLPARPHPWWAVALGWVGLALHAGVGAFPYLVSGLVAPPYGVLFLWALWGALLVVALRLRVRRPAWTPVVPIVAIALWRIVMLLGEAALGWQA